MYRSGCTRARPREGRGAYEASTVLRPDRVLTPSSLAGNGIPIRGEKPFGTLRDRWVGLVTRDPVLYGEVAAFLRERRIPTVSLLPGQRIPSRVAVVVTSREEAPRVLHPRVLVASPGDLTALGAALRDAMHEDSAPRGLLVGIDPGPRPGYAVLGPTGACLAEGVVESPEAVAALGRKLSRGFPRAHLTFRVGTGDHLRRNRIVNALLPLGAPVELANEEGTTLQGRRQNDSLAAKAIAATPGERVRGQELLRITPGEVANVQRISREMSGGLFTIPRELATSVLEGSTTMAEALERTAKKLGVTLPEAHTRRRGGSSRASPPSAT